MDPKIVYRFRLDDLIAFIFPKEFQHPLSTGRLYAFGECGPLDELGRLHSGFKGAHIVMDYELEEMCMQYEREDMVIRYFVTASLMQFFSYKVLKKQIIKAHRV